jgi:hypothetical protein
MRLPSMVIAVALAGCLDTPPGASPAFARLVTTWDPLACGDPHRVAVELDDDAGLPSTASVPCELGGVTVDVAHFGGYTGRIYAWAIGAPIRSVTPITVQIDEAVVRQQVATPE